MAKSVRRSLKRSSSPKKKYMKKYVSGLQKKSKKRSGSKRKPSAYNLFMGKKMREMKKKHPSMKQKSIMKMCAKKWKGNK